MPKRLTKRTSRHTASAIYTILVKIGLRPGTGRAGGLVLCDPSDLCGLGICTV